MEDLEEFGRLAMEADWVARMVYGDGSDAQTTASGQRKEGRQIVRRTM